MTNIIAKTIPALLTDAGDAAQAADNHGNEIGLWQNTAPKIRGSITALAEAADAFERARVELSRRRAVVRGLVVSSRGFLTLARDLFKPTLGPEYNEAWDFTGLTGSLVIPTSPFDLQPLLRSFKAFLTARPHEEVLVKQITAEKFDKLFIDLNDARASVRMQETAVNQAREMREEKFRLLRKRMRDLIAELNMVLDPLDPTWKAFGFNLPGASETPDAPENISATTIAPAKVDLKWEPAPRANYYRIWKRVAGTDQEPVVIGTAEDLDFMIEDLPLAATIELAVSAVNDGGESGLSELIAVKT